MSDLSRHLPLSNHARADESGVSGDWRVALAQVLEGAAALGVDETESDRFLRDADLARFAGRPLLQVAADVREGPRRRIRSLVSATRALLLLAGDRPVDIAPTTSGAVALYAATRMPFDRRAAVSGSTLVASDAGWSFGRGPARTATAREILAFVLGLGDDVPPLADRADGRKL